MLRRREPGLARPFQAWGYPWVTGLVLLVALAIVAGSFVGDPRHTLYAAGLIAVSLPLYRVFRSL